MLEKFILAVALTFSLSLFAQFGLFSSSQAAKQPHLQMTEAVVSSQDSTANSH